MTSLVVIKCGGSTMEQLPDSFFETLVQFQQEGKQMVIVHGGGPAINSMLGKLEIPAQFIDGLRFTCEQTIDVVEMVLGGSINKLLVRRLSQAGGKAWGISGEDGNLIVAKQTERPLGLVGEIVQIDTAPLKLLLAQGYIPVVAPLGISADGKSVLNINADVAAGAIAQALQADKLLLVTDVPGIMVPTEAGAKEIKHQIDTEEINELIATGVIYGGMIPKVQSALDALKQGVRQVVICQGVKEDIAGACSNGQVGTTITEHQNERV